MAPETKRSIWQIVGAIVTALAFLGGTLIAVGGYKSDVDRIKESDVRQWQLHQETKTELREFKNATERKVDEVSYNLQRLMEAKGVRYIKLGER